MSSVHRNVQLQRLVLEVTQAEMELIERAAKLTGCSLNDFAVGWLRDAALEVIETRPTIKLTVDDTVALLEAMENPPPPNEELRRLAREYREFFGEHGLT